LSARRPSPAQGFSLIHYQADQLNSFARAHFSDPISRSDTIDSSEKHRFRTFVPLGQFSGLEARPQRLRAAHTGAIGTTRPAPGIRYTCPHRGISITALARISADFQTWPCLVASFSSITNRKLPHKSRNIHCTCHLVVGRRRRLGRKFRQLAEYVPRQRSRSQASAMRRTNGPTTCRLIAETMLTAPWRTSDLTDDNIGLPRTSRCRDLSSLRG
jgi:hypothetical protein